MRSSTAGKSNAAGQGITQHAGLDGCISIDGAAHQQRAVAQSPML
jgi:hypothetical protein